MAASVADFVTDFVADFDAGGFLETRPGDGFDARWPG